VANPVNWVSLLVACGCNTAVAYNWSPVFELEAKPDKFSAGYNELDDFLGQILHESAMLTRVEEGLSYSSAERIAKVWPRRFSGPAAAAAYVRNPQALANFVYGGRMGNTDPDDGWRYRGRGLIQVTGRDNYRELGKLLGVPLEQQPDLLKQPAMALRTAVAWWERNVPDAIMGDIVRVTKRVNGGTVGLGHRKAITAAVVAALKS
jgi:putative chitinase